MPTIRLGEWVAEPSRGTVARRGVEARLEPKVMAVLVHLASRAGEVVPKQELLDAVWRDTHVVDAVLTRAVSLLRRTLEEDGDAGCRIETIPRKGYRLAGAVSLVSPARPGPRTIAVLPFQHLSGDRAREYLADGITEMTISSLSRVASLRVISRTSTARYRGTVHRLPEIARELGAEFVVEGSVMTAGEDLQVVAQLIDAATDTHVWSGEYRRPFRDVLSLQVEVARSIAREIEAGITPEEERRLSRSRPVDPRAHDAYLRGIYAFSRRSPDGFEAALGFFRDAVELDPSTALPRAWTALTVLLQAFYGFVPAREGFARCAEAAAEAIALDEELAEAYVARAGPRLFADHDFEAAERDQRRALALSPSLAFGRLALADLLVVTGRPSEALEQMEAAARLSPLDLGLGMNLGDHLAFARRWDEAIAQYRRTVRMDSGFRRGLVRLARACAHADRLDEAGQVLEAARPLPPGPGADDAYVLARIGRGDEARRVARSLEGNRAAGLAHSLELAQMHVALGESDEAFAWIERAFEEGHGWVVFLGIEPAFDPIRDDARFPSLLRRAGLARQHA